MQVDILRLFRVAALAVCRFGFVAGCITLSSASLLAQTSIQLFSPVNVRSSAAGTGFSSPVNFNTTTLNLSCAAPITGVLSSTADGTGKLLVDNNIYVTVTAGTTTTGPTNVCVGGPATEVGGTLVQNCFGGTYAGQAVAGELNGQDPDTFLSTGGIPAIDISSLLVPGPSQVQIVLQDEGLDLDSSTLYLDTSCTLNGVTGPAVVTGNPISASSPTSDQLVQNFGFNQIYKQQIGFNYDLSQAQAADSLTIADGTIPNVNDKPIDPTVFQTTWLPGTSFATSSCLIHAGEVTATGTPACKLFTLECTVGQEAGTTASGAQCPVSSMPNEIFQDTFDGPGFSLPDIIVPGGTTFHQGIGFLMANEGWAGGPCTFDPAAKLTSLGCPQNLLTSFTSSVYTTDSLPVIHAPGIGSGAKSLSSAAAVKPVGLKPVSNAVTSTSTSGSYIATGYTTHPNSTFISVAQVPEDLTAVSVADQSAGYWTKASSPLVTLTSQPPSLTGTSLPGAASFVASPIASITYGVATTATLPTPGGPSSSATITNSVPCPSPLTPGVPAATDFSTGQQSLSPLADGNYLIYYYAKDCAGTEELKYTQDGSGYWSTGFYTYSFGVDSTAPAVASGPALSPAASALGTYTVGQAVTASYSCTDNLSGIVTCGSHTYTPSVSSPVTSTGTLTTLVDTSSPGLKTFAVSAVDTAGNTSSVSVNYQVVAASTGYDSQIHFSITPASISYGEGTSVSIKVLPAAGSDAARAIVRSNTVQTPQGTVKILDGAKVIATLRLQGDGSAFDYLSWFAVGQHIITVSYSGDASDPSGTSAPVTLTVLPAPVRLETACWNASFPYGGNYFCGAYLSSDAGPPQGVITYKYDNGAAVKVPLVWGAAIFQVNQPSAGQHTIVISYAAQGNFAAATPQTEKFTVTPAPVNLSLTPSNWYLTGGNLTLTATAQSWSAGPPKSTGSVSFSVGGRLLKTAPVNASGSAAITIPASSLSNGNDTITATYSGGTNYGTGSVSIVIRVELP